MAANRDTARAMLDFAFGLAKFAHLPEITHFGFSANVDPVEARFSAADSWADNFQRIATWADAFDTKVLIDLSEMDTGYVRASTTVTVADRGVRLSVDMPKKAYREVELRFGLGRLESGDKVEVSGSRVLSAVKEAA